MSNTATQILRTKKQGRAKPINNTTTVWTDKKKEEPTPKIDLGLPSMLDKEGAVMIEPRGVRIDDRNFYNAYTNRARINGNKIYGVFNILDFNYQKAKKELGDVPIPCEIISKRSGRRNDVYELRSLSKTYNHTGEEIFLFDMEHPMGDGTSLLDDVHNTASCRKNFRKFLENECGFGLANTPFILLQKSPGDSLSLHEFYYLAPNSSVMQHLKTITKKQDIETIIKGFQNAIKQYQEQPGISNKLRGKGFPILIDGHYESNVTNYKALGFNVIS